MTTMPDEASMSNADRLQVQDTLRRLGYYKGQLDGIFGPLTRAAIRRFQGNIGAEMTGRLTAEEASRLVSTHWLPLMGCPHGPLRTGTAFLFWTDCVTHRLESLPRGQRYRCALQPVAVLPRSRISVGPGNALVVLR
jgi:hypothetical protein